MKTIWKFPLPMKRDFAMDVPTDFKPLSIQIQLVTPCIWALVDDATPLKKVLVAIRSTGESCENIFGYVFLGTFQVETTSTVFHVFIKE